MRPLVPHEKGQQPCFEVGDCGSQITVNKEHLDEKNAKDAKDGVWKFDQAMDSSAEASEHTYCSNAQCYEDMGRDILDHALEGYNGILVCYGQTGTGKTTTILGDKENGPGVLILMLEDLFIEVAKEAEIGGTITVSIQMLEVYNETVFDLLAAKKKCADDSEKSSIQIHTLPHGVQLVGVETKTVDSVEECLALLEHGNKNKHISATAMNPQSSRGHTIFKLLILKEEDDIHCSSEVYFADLAGHESEKLTKVQGNRLVELAYINKSLMWLQAAIKGLVEKGHDVKVGRKTVTGAQKGPSKVVLFRNSKLTLLLANALTGNSLINAIVTISPAAEHFPTSLSSLKFANEVKHLHVEAQCTAHKDPEVVAKSLKVELKYLKSVLAEHGIDHTHDASIHGPSEHPDSPKASSPSKRELREERQEVQNLKAMRVSMASALEESKLALEQSQTEANCLKEELVLAQEDADDMEQLRARREAVLEAVALTGTPTLPRRSRIASKEDFQDRGSAPKERGLPQRRSADSEAMSKQQWLTQEVSKIYREHNPDKLDVALQTLQAEGDSIQTQMALYKGCCDKYGVAPSTYPWGEDDGECSEIERVGQDERRASPDVLTLELSELELLNTSLKLELQAARDELLEAGACARGLRSELAESRMREIRMGTERQALLEKAPSNGLSSSSSRQEPSRQDLADQLFNQDDDGTGPDVTKFLFAISMKVDELCKDLYANKLGKETDELTSLIERARDLVPGAQIGANLGVTPRRRPPEIMLEAQPSPTWGARAITPSRARTPTVTRSPVSPAVAFPVPVRNHSPVRQQWGTNGGSDAAMVGRPQAAAPMCALPPGPNRLGMSTPTMPGRPLGGGTLVREIYPNNAMLSNSTRSVPVVRQISQGASIPSGVPWATQSMPPSPAFAFGVPHR